MLIQRKIEKVMTWVGGVEKQIRPSGWSPSANTVAYYKLEGDYKDYSGNGRDLSIAFGTAYYETLSSGKKVFKSSAGFNSGGWGLTRSDSVFNFTGDFTISFYVRLDAYSNNSSQPYSTFLANRSFSGSSYRRMVGIASQQFMFHGNAQFGNYAYSLNQWRHMVCVKSGSTYYIYENGTVKKSGSYTIGSGSPSVLNLGWGYNNQERANCAMGDVIFENKARTASDVSDYYNLTKSNYGL